MQFTIIVLCAHTKNNNFISKVGTYNIYIRIFVSNSSNSFCKLKKLYCFVVGKTVSKHHLREIYLI